MSYWEIVYEKAAPNSSQEPFLLSDRACLLLPVMLFSNRLGQTFYMDIAPDEFINTNQGVFIKSSLQFPRSVQVRSPQKRADKYFHIAHPNNVSSFSLTLGIYREEK